MLDDLDTASGTTLAMFERGQKLEWFATLRTPRRHCHARDGSAPFSRPGFAAYYGVRFQGQS